jgi:hypothetical protein
MIERKGVVTHASGRGPQAENDIAENGRWS